MPYTNWAGNYTYQAQKRYHVQSVDDVQELVRGAEKVKVLGSRHSFNHIADTTADHLSLAELNQVLSLDPDAQTVTVEGGINYGHLARYLHGQGFALHNMASLPHISVAGACATATHGSGEGNGNLATVVRALDVITASGDIVTFSRDETPDTFPGVVVGLGAIGVVVSLTLDVEPTYQMRQVVYRELPFSQMLKHFDDLQASAYSVSLFTDWQGDTINQVWLKQRVTDDEIVQPAPELYGAALATENLHPIEGISAVNCTEQLGVVGAWHGRLPHFKMDFTPSSGDELQSEYFVPRSQAQAALQAIQSLQDKIAPLLLTSEIRTIAADDLWMSPCYEQDCVAFHCTWKQMSVEVMQVLPLMERQLDPMQVIPHWGKLFTMSAAELHSRFTRLDDFRQLISTHDPNRKFGNSFLEEHIYKKA
jgi:xylitol oxidase